MDYESIYAIFKQRERSKIEKRQPKYTEFLQITSLSSTGLMLVKPNCIKNDEYIFNGIEPIQYNEAFFLEIQPTAELMSAALKNGDDEIRVEAIKLCRALNIFCCRQIATITGLEKSQILAIVNPPKKEPKTNNNRSIHKTRKQKSVVQNLTSHVKLPADGFQYKVLTKAILLKKVDSLYRFYRGDYHWFDVLLADIYRLYHRFRIVPQSEKNIKRYLNTLNNELNNYRKQPSRPASLSFLKSINDPIDFSLPDQPKYVTKEYRDIYQKMLSGENFVFLSKDSGYIRRMKKRERYAKFLKGGVSGPKINSINKIAEDDEWDDDDDENDLEPMGEDFEGEGVDEFELDENDDIAAPTALGAARKGVPYKMKWLGGLISVNIRTYLF